MAIRIIGLLFLLVSFLGETEAQNDEKYYYKLGKKYIFNKDYETAAKHFDKCMSIAEKNKNENANYYYYPLLMYYYGAAKLKQAKKATVLITELVPAAPNVPGADGSAKERYFDEFFGAFGNEIDRSDYIFLRHYVHFQSNEMEEVETFDGMEFAVRYHGKKSMVPLQASFDFMKGVSDAVHKDDADPVAGAAPFKERLCDIFEKAWKAGNTDAKPIVVDNCF